MSKERQRRRAQRERERAIQAAARAADAERQERRTARRRAIGRRFGLDTLAGARYSTSRASRSRQSGLLAQRRRHELTITLCLLAAFNIVVWISRDDWGSRAGALAVSLLVAPVVHVLLHQRR
jgi:hypothetical protein